MLAGLTSGLFLMSLELATQTQEQHRFLLLGLPFIGFLIGWLYHHYGKDIARGNNLILDEIHDPQKTVPFRMAPLIWGATLLTHLFGGSAGREGTAVQMGASLSDQLSRFFRVKNDERKILLMAGAGAAFGAAIGTPWAGAIFGMEVINVGRLKIFAWFECLIASFVGYATVLFIGGEHTQYPNIQIPAVNIKTVIFVVLAGICFGLTAKFFSALTHTVEMVHEKFISYSPLRPFFGGLIVVSLFYLEGSFRYVGLGIPFIQQSLIESSSFYDPIFKSILTALTIGSGFKGGEFIPLVFIGSTLGSALSLMIPLSFSFLGALGFAAVFAGAANTPIACSLMAMELFGPRIAPFAFITCFVSYFCSGNQGIYPSQKFDFKKNQILLSVSSFLKK